MRRVEGVWIEETGGRRLIDLHGNTAHLLGHAHPELREALIAQLSELPFCPRRYTNRPAVELVEALIERWPGGEAAVLLAPSGSDAIEIALRLARACTGRFETISIEGSYHGNGFGALGLSEAALDPRLGPHLPGRHHVTTYWREDGAERMIEDIGRAFASSRTGISAVIAEPMRSNCHVPPAWLWPEVRALCDTYGALLVFDEIPSGLGRTGRFFAFEHFGVCPDIAVLGKSLGGGMLPLAAVIADRRVDVAPELDLGHYTHEKNPLLARAGLTTLRIIARDGLAQRAEAMGARLRAGLASIASARGIEVTPRGLGALLAVRFPGCPADGDGGLVARCHAAGLSTTGKGSDSVGLCLPLTASEAEIDETIHRFDAVASRLKG